MLNAREALRAESVLPSAKARRPHRHYTIYIPPDLSEPDYRRALQFWSGAATRRRSPSKMLGSAGFVDVSEKDVTKQYRATARAWLDGRRRCYDDLKKAMGATALDGKIGENEFMLGLLKDGLLRRSLLTARRGS